MNIEEVMRACEREIVDLHRFFVDWFRGDLPDTEEAWSRVTRALDEGFELITPGGESLPRNVLLDGIRARHGQHGPADDFTIWTCNVDVRYADASFVLVTYEEWQLLGGDEKGRRSTVLFALDPNAPNGLRWRHVHETWLPDGACPPGRPPHP